MMGAAAPQHAEQGQSYRPAVPPAS